MQRGSAFTALLTVHAHTMHVWVFHFRMHACVCLCMCIHACMERQLSCLSGLLCLCCVFSHIFCCHVVLQRLGASLGQSLMSLRALLAALSYSSSCSLQPRPVSCLPRSASSNPLATTAYNSYNVCLPCTMQVLRPFKRNMEDVIPLSATATLASCVLAVASVLPLLLEKAFHFLLLPKG